jgi:diadenosine tetraphosphatase ApaH/serine/threonine PP2A family protein phosphatase
VGLRYGIISDIHGNLDALESVVRSAGALDGWLCLGDIVGYGPQPNECVDIVRSLCRNCIVGNHDLAALGSIDIRWFNPHALAAVLWTQEQITDATRQFLDALPQMQVVPEWDATLSHGSLTDPPRDYIITRSDARVNFKMMQTRALFVGHSHVSHCFSMQDEDAYCDEDVFVGGGKVQMEPDSRYIVNCGSVGQPRDGDPRAAYGILDIGARTVDVFRVAYDIQAVQEKMRGLGLPAFLARRLARGV